MKMRQSYRRNWLLVTWRKTASWPGWRTGRGRLLGVLIVLLAIGLAGEAWNAGRSTWGSLHRPTAVYRRTIRDGVAVSLNGLEKNRKGGARLPAMDIRGVLVDRANNDWIIFGDAAPSRPGISVDAVGVAIRALRLHVQAPGVDIRSASGRGTGQEVTYFGGVDGTVVGEWFFRFDYWMKRASLGKDRIEAPGVPAYWDKAVQAMEDEVSACRSAGPASSTRHNRYWLCTDRFDAIEDRNALAFQKTPLVVLTESLMRAGDSPSDPGTKGAEDPLATDFANALTSHVNELGGSVPVAEIESFARLLAGFTWLTGADPYRDLSFWLSAEPEIVKTAETVRTETVQAVRDHPVSGESGPMRHQHRLEISGGVTIKPTLRLYAVGDDSLERLRRAVIESRPKPDSEVWRFTYELPRP